VILVRAIPGSKRILHAARRPSSNLENHACVSDPDTAAPLSADFLVAATALAAANGLFPSFRLGCVAPHQRIHSETAMSHSKSTGHIKRNKTARHRAKLKAKLKKARLRQSRGNRATYR